MDEIDYIDLLQKKYPLVFNHMESGGYSFIPSGWYGLIDELCQKLDGILKESYGKYSLEDFQCGFRVMQIKEKFGSLRFYFSCDSDDPHLYDKVASIIGEAELKSSRICEITGQPGQICVSGNWLKTLCEEERIKKNYKILETKKGKQ